MVSDADYLALQRVLVEQREQIARLQFRLKKYDKLHSQLFGVYARGRVPTIALEDVLEMLYRAKSDDFV